MPRAEHSGSFRGKNGIFRRIMPGICNWGCHGDRGACNVYIIRGRFRPWRVYMQPCRDVHERVRVRCTRRTHSFSFTRMCPHVCMLSVSRHTYVRTNAESRPLCCARGHDNSAEKPRNICPAAINSGTAATFLANLHKTVTYHSIIRPIRPTSLPLAREISSPVFQYSPSGARFSLFLSLGHQVVRIVFYLAIFSPLSAIPYKSARCRRHGRRRKLFAIVHLYGAANSTLFRALPARRSVSARSAHLFV